MTKPAQSQKVLIVDDEPRNQRIISETLDGVVDSRTAGSAEEALQIADQYLPDLVLLDIMMPGMDGYEACRRIKSDSKHAFTKIILVSGKAMLEERLKGYEVGADDYMTKPFVPEELLAKAKVFLRLAQLEKELSEMNRSLDEKVKERTRQLLETEAKLVNAAKMSALGEMAGGIAHEINTPLCTISMVADQLGEMVADDPLDKEEIQRRIDIVGKTVKRISSIILGLKAFSRDGSHDPFDSAPLKQIIDNTLVLCQERIKQIGINFTIDAIPSDLKIRCQPVQISQVLLNLIGNACDAVATLEQKWIKIQVEPSDDHVRISITDSGGGISPHIREKLFQPFFTTKEIGKGTGLGLSISKGIVDNHGGKLELDSSASNTRFVLQLPLGKTAA